MLVAIGVVPGTKLRVAAKIYFYEEFGRKP